jgi:hypothetical protein
MTSAIRVLTVLTAGLALTQSISAQSPAATCRTCTIQKTLSATLGRTSDPATAAFFAPLSVDRRGRYLTFSHDNTQVVVFGADGRLQQTLGRRGQGPGEYTRIRQVLVTSSDSILVSQAPLVSVLAPDGRFVRQYVAPLTGIQRIFPLSSGTVFLTMPDKQSGAFLHRITPLGTVQRSFGESDCATCSAHHFAQTGDTGFLSLPPFDYTIQRWSSDGVLRGKLPVRSTYAQSFKTISEEEQRERTRARLSPMPALAGVVVDAQNRLWIVAHRPSKIWKPSALPTSGRVAGVAIMRVTDNEEEILSARATNFDTIVEVVDAKTGEVIASQLFEADHFQLLAPGLAYDQTVDADGVVHHRVWKLTVAGLR